jgi:hypothetical protein
MNVVTVEQGADMTQRIPESFSMVTNDLPPRDPNDNDDDEDEDAVSPRWNVEAGCRQLPQSSRVGTSPAYRG